MKKANISQTITVVEENITKKVKRKLYLVLKKKGFADEIIDNIDNELEKRLIEFIKNIAPKLNEMNFDDSEKSLECLMVKQAIKILDDMIKERMLKLNEEDKKALYDLFENENKEKKEQSP